MNLDVLLSFIRSSLNICRYLLNVFSPLFIHVFLSFLVLGYNSMIVRPIFYDLASLAVIKG